VDERFLLESVLSILKAAGAEGDAYLEQRRSLNFQIREGQLQDISRADVRGLAVRAMKDGRLGFVYTSALDAGGIKLAAENALALARSASPREDLVLPDPSGPGDGRDEGEPLQIFDATLEKRPLPEKQEWARAAEAVARGYDPKITRTEGVSYEENLVSSWIANTEGLFRHQKKSGLEVGIQVIAEDGEAKQPGETQHRATRWDDLPDPGGFGRRAGERAIRLLGGGPVATGRYPVVFAPEAGWALLVYLAVALRGDHMSRGRSWLSGRTDELLGSPMATIHDDGRRVGGLGSAAFDGEGVDTRDLVLLDQGKIRGNLLDLASAKRLGTQSTGSSRRGGYAALPEIASSNLYLSPGNAKPEEIIGRVEKGLWVWGLSGWWIGLDPSNPQFSSAASGLWIEKGKPVRPVARVTVAGPIQEILAGVEEVGNDLVWDAPTKMPTVRIKEMAVSGT
jgi:PmbA protein